MSIEGPGRTQREKITDNKDGTYDITFIPFRSGTYNFFVQYEAVNLRNSSPLCLQSAGGHAAGRAGVSAAALGGGGAAGAGAGGRSGRAGRAGPGWRPGRALPGRLRCALRPARPPPGAPGDPPEISLRPRGAAGPFLPGGSAARRTVASWSPCSGPGGTAMWAVRQRRPVALEPGGCERASVPWPCVADPATVAWGPWGGWVPGLGPGGPGVPGAGPAGTPAGGKSGRKSGRGLTRGGQAWRRRWSGWGSTGTSARRRRSCGR